MTAGVRPEKGNRAEAAPADGSSLDPGQTYSLIPTDTRGSARSPSKKQTGGRALYRAAFSGLFFLLLPHPFFRKQQLDVSGHLRSRRLVQRQNLVEQLAQRFVPRHLREQ